MWERARPSLNMPGKDWLREVKSLSGDLRTEECEWSELVLPQPEVRAF